MNDDPELKKGLEDFIAEYNRKKEQLQQSKSPKRPAPQDAPSKKAKTQRSYVCNLCPKPKPDLNDTGNLQDHICNQHLHLGDEVFYNAMKKSIRRSLQAKWEKRVSDVGLYKCPECDYYRNEQRQIRVHATNLHLDSMTPSEFKTLMKKVDRMRSKTKSTDSSPKELDEEAEALRASVVSAVRDAFRARDEAYKNLKESYASEIVDLSLAVVSAPTMEHDEHFDAWKECVHKLKGHLEALATEHGNPPTVHSFFDEYDANRTQRDEAVANEDSQVEEDNEDSQVEEDSQDNEVNEVNEANEADSE